MLIKNARIKNFRCHKDLTIDFCRLHALVGENATGKTAILEALNFVTSPFYLASRISEQDFNNADTGDISIEVDFDKYFIVRVPDGYTTQALPCNSIRLTVKRREKAATARALNDGYVISHLCTPLIFSKRQEVSIDLLPKDFKSDELPESCTATPNGFQVTRKSGSKMSLRQETILLSIESLDGLLLVWWTPTYAHSAFISNSMGLRYPSVECRRRGL